MILLGNKLYDDVVDCNGLLIVGDPHVSSRRPGRRTDEDWPGPILAKLEHCAKVSRERGLATVFLGDLFDSAVESDESLKTKLVRILKDFHMVVVSNTGNHDMRNTRLSDGDSLAMLAASDVLDVVALSGPVMEIGVEGKRIGIGMTPYGQDIPRSVAGMFPDADATVWFTHHDIAFGNAYPGAVQPFEIEGCGLAINGHVHDTKDNRKVGRTLWVNPGNINRQTVDLMGQKPTAWVLHGTGQMEPVELPHRQNVFDLTGSLVAAIEVKDLPKDVDSAFVSLLEAETAMEMSSSSDGSILRREIEAKFERDGTPQNVRSAIIELLEEAARRRSAA